MTVPTRASATAGALPLVAAVTGVLSVACTAATALLGPSAAEAPLGAGARPPYHRFLPPYALDIRPSSALVTVLLVTAVVAGTVALAAALLALHRGWLPRARRVAAAGVVAAALLAVLPPIGSADPLSYAAYGRAAATGHDPYAVRPRTLAAAGDPVARAVLPPWRDTPSAYGPIATAEQRLVAAATGDDVASAVLLLGLLNAAAFAGAGLLLLRVARDHRERSRAALLWLANPLLLLEIVAGAHLDALAALAAVAALAVAARRGWWAAVAAGAIGGAAAAVKLPLALVGAGLAWAERRSPRRLLGLAVGALAVLAPAYLLAGPHVLDQTRRASRFVSVATPWRPVVQMTDRALGFGSSRDLVAVLSLVAAAALAALLWRALPGRADPSRTAARTALVLVLAWLLAAAYALPWYDATAWALLVMLPGSWWDALLLARTSVLSLAYVPGLAVGLSPEVGSLTHSMRAVGGPIGLGLVVVAAVWLSLRPVHRGDP